MRHSPVTQEVNLSRFRLLLSTGAAIALAAALPASASAANSCRKASTARGNQIVTASKGAVVFSSRKLKQDVACTYKHKRQVKLEKFACCSLLRYTLGGRYLAYAYRLDEAFNEVDELGVVDLQTGKRVKYSGMTRVDTNGYMRSFYVTSSGTLAWLQEFAATDEEPEPTGFQVRAAGRGGPVKELDSGNIGAGSLGVSSNGKTLYWTKDGATQTAALE